MKNICPEGEDLTHFWASTALSTTISPGNPTTVSMILVSSAKNLLSFRSMQLSFEQFLQKRVVDEEK